MAEQEAQRKAEQEAQQAADAAASSSKTGWIVAAVVGVAALAAGGYHYTQMQKVEKEREGT